MRVSWTRTAELVRMRVLLWAALLAVPTALVWLALVGRAEPIAIALLTCGALLLALLPTLAPSMHAIDVHPDRIVLHPMLGPSRTVRRDAVLELLLVPGMETLRGVDQVMATPRIVVVGSDRRALGRGSWTTLTPDVHALRAAGLRVRIDSGTRRPGAVEARAPGSTTRLERMSFGGICGLGIAAAVGMSALALCTVLLLD